MERRSVLYLHGFASSPQGRKIALLRERLEPSGFTIVAPDLNAPSFERLDFEAMVRIALEAAAVHAPSVVVGSSLGALVALAADRRGVDAPLVLLAPALGFGARWTEKLPEAERLPFFHHGAGEEKLIHRAFFESMAREDASREPPRSRVVVLMGRQDESVPYALVEDVWCRWVATKRLPGGSRFVEVPTGDHGLLEHVDLIAAEIREAAAVD